ncbi:hypothetical protein [Agromyces laixinhei]|uniref:hypothetical protein n=1 Tax=Agromyces laixinhei TaxID=2585717 RepID=UPI0011162A17|nr:hypothetical protein [Agromyces laixinhei]
MVRRLPAIAVVFLMMFATLLPASSARAAETAAAQPDADPARVAIPYLGTASIDIAAPWSITDCAAPLAATPLVTACEAGKISLAAPVYDPDAGATALRLSLSDGRITTTTVYQVVLEPPAVPTATPSSELRPAPAGSLLRIPISDLGLECQVCSDTGGNLRAVAVQPASAGSLWATPTHLVFRAAADARGPVELVFRFADDFGSWSADAKLGVSILDPVDRPLATADVVVELVEGGASVDLNELAFPLGGGELIVVGCGNPVRGQVRCAADGTAEYRGDGGTDQFSFQVATADGGRGFGSVTVVPAGATEPGAGTAPIAPPKQSKQGVPVFVPPAVPVEDDAAADGGLLRPLLSVFDRVGA